MRGEAIFEFKCGTKMQAAAVADWLECENWPADLRSELEETFGDLSDLVSIVASADVIDRRVRVHATEGSHLDMMEAVLDYALQKWRSMPSPQGFTFGVARRPDVDPVSYESLNLGEYDGGAVLLRRGAEPEYFSASQWLREARSQTRGK